jgi:hypothetical protein
MSDVSKRFEQLVKSVYKKFVDQGFHLPEKTPQGIKVGRVLIRSNGSLKDIIVNEQVIYEQISLNSVAIRIANELASNKNSRICKDLIEIDREYSKHFIDSKFHVDNYHKAINANNSERADILWTRYEIAKEKALSAKSRAEDLAGF